MFLLVFFFLKKQKLRMNNEFIFESTIAGNLE